jgi:G3E family GTPase
MPVKKMKVAVITGFLGAGKTTVLNKLVEKNGGKRIAVIENEFGEINIDRKLIAGVEGNNIYELSNGCLCCTLNDEFGVLLNSLILANLNADYLIIETTGIADPGDIIQTFLRGGRIYEYFELLCVICVVDAANMRFHVSENAEAAKQIALADVIMLNKIDAVGEDELPAIMSGIRTYNMEAEIITAVKGDTEKFSLETETYYSPAAVEEKLRKTIKEKHNEEHEGHHHSHKHEVESYSFFIKGELPLRKFAIWLDAFITFSSGVYRVKGILNVEGEENRYILQAVNKAFSILEGSRWEEGAERLNEIVFIGKGINKNDLEKSLNNLTGA